MNVFSKITLSSLKKNRTRTIVTIIGVILSVAMITAVTTLIASLQSFMIRNVIATDGDWHVQFMEADSALVQRLSADNEVAAAAVSQNIGSAVLEGGQNENKPYLFVAGFDDKAMEMIPIRLLDGRLPQNDREIVINSQINNAGVRYKIGDTLNLTLGHRVLAGKRLGQNNPFVLDDQNGAPRESFVPESPKAYTIVGICEKPRFEDYSAPGYTVITKMNLAELGDADRVNVFTKLRYPAKVYEFAQSVGGGSGYTYNNDLLRYMGISKDETFNAVLYRLGGIFILLIMLGSILLIHNSFSISVAERTRQFGILSSVGATPKQLRRSVLLEGAWIGLIGIPLGIMAGIGGIGITLSLMSDIFASLSYSGVHMKLSLSLPSLVTAGVVGIITILISAYIPARKAARLSAIDAIRQTTDIKINAKKVKTSRLVPKLFGLEGTLALKNFKRNKKGYRSTVISLFVSVVLFISASAFGIYLQESAETTINESGYDILFRSTQTTDEELPLYEKLRNVSGVYDSGFYKALYYEASLPKGRLTERYLEHYYGDSLPAGDMVPINVALCLVDDGTYAAYVKDLGLDPQKYAGENTDNMIAMTKINKYDDESGRYVSFDVLQGSLPLSLQLSAPGEPSGGSQPGPEITVTYIADRMPETISESRGAGFLVFAPYSMNSRFSETRDEHLTFAFLSTDPGKSAEEMNAILKDEGIFSGYSLYNIAQIQEQNRNVIILINVFSYGFILLISLIAIANVFNTVSTNINLRRREFAILKSVGMSYKGFNKMMNFECVFYGLKSLLYGLPVAFIITYLIYRSVMTGADVVFLVPWMSVGISVFSVFLVVFVTMMYSVSKVKKENTADALKNEAL